MTTGQGPEDYTPLWDGGSMHLAWKRSTAASTWETTLPVAMRSFPPSLESDHRWGARELHHRW